MNATLLAVPCWLIVSYCKETGDAPLSPTALHQGAPFPLIHVASEIADHRFPSFTSLDSPTDSRCSKMMLPPTKAELPHPHHQHPLCGIVLPLEMTHQPMHMPSTRLTQGFRCHAGPQTCAFKGRAAVAWVCAMTSMRFPLRSPCTGPRVVRPAAVAVAVWDATNDCTEASAELLRT